MSLADGFHFGFRGGFNSGDHLGYETGYMYNRTKLQFNNPHGVTPSEGMAYHQVMFNALWYFTPADSRIRPFATGGAGFTNYAAPGTSAAYGGGTTKLGVNYGGGVKIRVASLLRTPLRPAPGHHAQTLRFPLASGWLRETEISAGFGVFF